MTRAYGWSARSERCVCKSPYGHWRTNTFIAALRMHGLYAPWLLDGLMDGQCFLIYLGEVLAPSLRPGDHVISDNLSSHRSEAVATLLGKLNVEILYLPPYSPDMNPIETVFAKIKSLLKKAEPRNLESLIREVANTLTAFTKAECFHYLQHAQYGLN
jgi:transposase